MRLTERLRRIGDDGGPLVSASDHRHGRVGRDRLLECVDVVHGDDRVDGVADETSRRRSAPYWLCIQRSATMKPRTPSGFRMRSPISMKPTKMSLRPRIVGHARRYAALRADGTSSSRMYGRVAQYEVSDVLAVSREKEVAALDAVGRDRLRLDVVEPCLDQCASDGLLRELCVHGEQVEGSQRGPNVGKRATVDSARLDETLGHRCEERSRPARGFDGDHAAEIAVGREARQIQDQLDDPATSEHFAVLTCLVDLEHVRVYFLPQVEAELSLFVPVGPGHRVPPNYSSSIGVHWNRA